MGKFDEWWENTVFSCGFSQHKATARSAFEAATLIERERCSNIAKNLVAGPGLDIIGQAYVESINKEEK